MILDDMDVFAMLTRQSLPSLATGVDICSSMNLQASLQANLKGSSLEHTVSFERFASDSARPGERTGNQ